MKKFYIFAIICVTSLLLFACNNKTTQLETGPKATEENSGNAQQNQVQDQTADEKEEPEQTDIDLDAFIEDATKVNKEITSFSTAGTVNTIQTYGNEKNLIVKTQEEETVLEPFQYKSYEKREQKGEPDSESEGVVEEEITTYKIDGVMYINYNGLYGDGERWYKEKNKYSDDEMRAHENIDIERMLGDWDEVTLDKVVDVNDDEYILTLNIDAEKFTSMQKESPGFAQSDDEKVNQKLLDTYTIEYVEHQFKFDKESKRLVAIESKMKYSYEMDFNDQTDTMMIEETSVTQYENQNNLEKVDFPAEIAENAVQLGD